jgi:single-strand DNA-binding protein
MPIYENNIRLKGYTGKSAQTLTKAGSTGNAIVVFSLATRSRVRDRATGEWSSRTEWHRIVCFGDAATAARGLERGDYVEVEGTLRSSEYDARDGSSSPRRTWEIRAARVQKLERPVARKQPASASGQAA